MIDGTDELADDLTVHDVDHILHHVEQVASSLLEEGHHVIEGGVLAKPVECDTEEVVW